MIEPGILPLSIIRGIEFSGLILQCKDDSVVVTGTLTPDVTGTYLPNGTFSNYPLFILEGSPSTFLYFNTAESSYVIARLLTDAALTDYWSPTVALTEPTGTYSAHGANSGTATASDNPVDLTDYDVEATVRRTVNATDIFIDLNPSVTDDTGGQITIPPMTSAVTNDLLFTGSFMWDLVLTQHSGADRFGPYIKGKFTVADNITQIT